MATYNKAGVLEYLAIALDQGLVNGNTGNAWRAAVNKIMGDLPDDEDVENYDMRAAVLRFNNKNPGELTGESLKKYEQRAKMAVDQYIKWKSDPLNYKPPSRGLPSENKAKSAPKKNGGQVPATTETKLLKAETGQYSLTGHPPNLHIGKPETPRLTIPFPLRRDFISTIVIPHDMTVAEAKRMSVMIEALGHDTPTEVQKT